MIARMLLCLLALALCPLLVAAPAPLARRQRHGGPRDPAESSREWVLVWHSETCLWRVTIPARGRLDIAPSSDPSFDRYEGAYTLSGGGLEVEEWRAGAPGWRLRYVLRWDGERRCWRSEGGKIILRR